MEKFPALGDRETQMEGYWETSHYKGDIGNLMMDKIFNFSESDRHVPEDFGVLLTSKNITRHLS